MQPTNTSTTPPVRPDTPGTAAPSGDTASSAVSSTASSKAPSPTAAQSTSPRVLPPRPPRIPLRRRLARSLFQAWPAIVWCGALAGAIYFYTGLDDPGQALAHEEILEVSASPSVAGRLATLSVDLGTEVKAGDVIATLDASDVDAQIRFAQTRLERSRTRIDVVRAELEMDARDRQAQAASRRASFEAEGRRIRTSIDGMVADETSDRAELESLAPQIERLRPLAEDNLITLDRLEQLVQTRTVLEARLGSQAQRLRAAREELALWEQFAPDTVIEADISARLVPFELELEAQEARVAELELERAKYEVLAPASGVVNVVAARPGEWRAAGDPIVELVVRVPQRVTAYLPGMYARTVEPSTPATLRSRDRKGDPLDGAVVSVGPRMELIPRQLRAMPNVPEWGRRVSIAIINTEPPLPGEVYTVRFH